MKISIALALLLSLFVVTQQQDTDIETDVETKVIYESDSNRIEGVALNLAADIVAIADVRQIIIIDLKTEKILKVLETEYEIHDLAWDSTGDRLAVFDACGPSIWDMDTGEKLNIEFEQEINILCLNWGAIAWSPDDKRIAGSVWGSKLSVWDVQTGERLELIEYPGEVPSTDLSWNPDGSLIANATLGVEEVQIWDLTKLENSFILPCERCRVYSLAWSPDGSMLAASGEIITEGAEDTIWIWNTDTFELHSTFSRHSITWDIVWDAASSMLLTTDGEVWTVDGELVETLDVLPQTAYRSHVTWNSTHQIAAISTPNEVQLITNLAP